MPYLNKATIMGHLGRDAESKFTPGGKCITSMSIAVADGTKDKPHTTWVRVEGWDLPDWIHAHLKKGALVLVDGRLRFEEWDDKDGGKKSMTKLVADGYGVKTFDKKADDGIVSQPRGAAARISEPGVIDDDDIPF
jgi:single-strand DNA-binding protein